MPSAPTIQERAEATLTDQLGSGEWRPRKTQLDNELTANRDLIRMISSKHRMNQMFQV